MFHGEIVFEIADTEHIEVDFGTEIVPTKIVTKGDVIALGRKAPKYRWMYEIKYNGDKEYLESLDKMVNKLCKKKEHINQLTEIFEEVSINIYIRSDFAEIGYYMPSCILKKIALLECAINFEILSFGMTKNEVSSK